MSPLSWLSLTGRQATGRHRREGWLAAPVVSMLFLAVVAGCGSARHRVPVTQPRVPASATTARPTTSANTAGNVELALLHQKSPPRPTAASCRAPTANERARATIGGADSMFFSCGITLNGQPARLYVQVLSNGSFIAENERHDQQQIFGCCVAHTPD
jgi:hypothetical protein